MAIVSEQGGPLRVLDFGQVQVQIQIAELTEETFEAHLEAETRRLNGYLRGRDSIVPRKAVIILDGSCDLVPKASIRRLQADWLKQHHDLLKLVCHAMGVILPNVLVRNAMTAVLWLAPLPLPMTAHKDMESALAWAIREADAIGGDVDADLRAGRRAVVEKYLKLARFSPASLDELLKDRAAARAANELLRQGA